MGKARCSRRMQHAGTLPVSCSVRLEFHHQGENPPPLLFDKVRRESRNVRPCSAHILIKSRAYLRSYATWAAKGRNVRPTLRPFHVPRHPLAGHVVEAELEILGLERQARSLGKV